MKSPVFHLIPHTHWDREWYGTRAAFLSRLLPMLDGARGTLRATPGLPFLLDGQTVVVEDYLTMRPEAHQEIASLVAAGQLQTGPSRVLVDELVPSAESLVRNLLQGRRDLRSLGGKCRTLYSPDAFGHPSALPMLAHQFGLSGIVLWRGRAGQRDFFHWRAPDGSALPVYHLPSAGYEVGEALPSDPARLAAAWPPLRDDLMRRAASRHIAVFIGADHHPLRTDLRALVSAMAELDPSAEVRLSSLDDFMAAAGPELSDAEVVSGELRGGEAHTWSLQGVHGTRLPLKRLNALTELLLERHAEPLAALASRAHCDDQRPLLDMAWRLVVETQFHDTICGTVHDDAAEEATQRLRDAGVLGRAARSQAMDRLGAVPDVPLAVDRDAGTLLLWNPRATQAGGVVMVDITQFREDVLVGPPDGRRARRMAAGSAPALILDDGTVLRTQIVRTGSGVERLDSALRYPDADRVDVTELAVVVPPMPGLGFGSARLSAARAGVHRSAKRVRSSDGVSADRHALCNQHLRVLLREDGALDLYARNGVTLRRILELERQSDLGDCYTASLRGPVRKLPAPASWRVVAAGPLLAAVEGHAGTSDLRYRLRLELRHGEAFLRVRIDLDNHATDQRVRLRVPIGAAPYAVAGAPFGYERRRPAEPSRSEREQVTPTAPAQRFVAAASADGGAALLTPGHMEYELREDGTLLFTLLRSTGQLSRADLPERPGHAAWPTPVPGAQCHGRCAVHFALLPCASHDADDATALMAAWEEAFLGLHPKWHRGRTAAAPGISAELVGHGLVVSAIKPAEQGEGMVLRAVNLQDREVSGAWRISPSPTEAWLLRADETRIESLAIEAHAIPFRVGPRALATILVV
ncbi:MAG TPA: glycoside hydrolase family 38 C-terminal domain-containing protein [Gemmatimonadales bacterium]|nr:glycoside hydrolase family 38 C-terminal domain-containing protein [Gemmatimonadales bacterium]